MICYNCGNLLSENDFCTACGADVFLYKKIMYISNMYYNEGLEKALVRDLTGAVTSLRQSLKFNKNHIEARNLLGLVYFETGEVVSALSEWVISKNMQPEKNIADDFIEKLQSNSNRLSTLNQTIKKYNQALAYCNQDSKDLAVIQLKKVLSMNPRFVRAHQLLALLFINREEWENAERELRKCMDIDRNNLQTLRYIKEVEQRMMPEDTAKPPARQKKEESVRYQSENEVIIQPLNVKEPKRSGVSTLLNMGIGIVIGLAVMYFLVVPSAEAKVRNEEQQTITKISNESDIKTARIQELESQITNLQWDIENLNERIEGYIGEEGTLQTIDEMLSAAAVYIEKGDAHETAQRLETIANNVNVEEMPEGFQALYGQIFSAIGPGLAEEYYREGHEYYRTNDYAMAIEVLGKAVYYDAGNVEALFELGQAYRMSGDNENAIIIYDRVIELFPDTVRANNAKQYRDTLASEN